MQREIQTNLVTLIYVWYLKKFGKDYFRKSIILGNLANEVDFKIEAFPMTPKDMNVKYSTLASEIKKYESRLI